MRRLQRSKRLICGNLLLEGKLPGPTSSIYIKDGILYVQLKSSIVRNELFMMRNEIMQAMNQRIGRRVVKAVILK